MNMKLTLIWHGVMTKEADGLYLDDVAFEPWALIDEHLQDRTKVRVTIEIFNGEYNNELSHEN